MSTMHTVELKFLQRTESDASEGKFSLEFHSVLNLYDLQE